MNKIELITNFRENGKKHIIFDFDDTLCTLLVDWSVSIKEMQNLFSYGGKSVNKDFFASQNDYVRQNGEEARNKILDINYRNERDYYRGYQINEKALSLLPELSGFSKIYLWTSNDRRTILPILDELDIKKFFTGIVTRNDVTYIKPDPEGYYLINPEKNLESQYVLIGDSRADSIAAQNAHIDFINVKEII